MKFCFSFKEDLIEGDSEAGEELHVFILSSNLIK